MTHKFGFFLKKLVGRGTRFRLYVHTFICEKKTSKNSFSFGLLTTRVTLRRLTSRSLRQSVTLLPKSNGGEWKRSKDVSLMYVTRSRWKCHNHVVSVEMSRLVSKLRGGCHNRVVDTITRVWVSKLRGGSHRRVVDVQTALWVSKSRRIW